jgi:hypothetical protein
MQVAVVDADELRAGRERTLELLRRRALHEVPERAGAQRARDELTWDAAARAHVALYEEIV